MKPSLRKPPTRRRVLLAFSLLGVLSPWLSRALGEGVLAWLADLMAHWALAWLLLGLLCLPGALPSWRWRLAAALALGLLPWLSLPSALPVSAGGSTFSVVTANLHLSNRDPAALKAWLAPAPPDLLALVEVGPGFAAAWGNDARWPHRHWQPSEDPFGLALLSRWPLESVKLEQDAGGIPRLRALVRTPRGLVEVLVVHPMPPISPEWAALRDRSYAALRPSGVAPALMLGDFNASPWSRAAQLLEQGGWRWSGGLRPTWPSPWLGIPIDTVWAQGAWSRQAIEVGPDIGSDHRPLRVTLRRE